MDIVFNKGLVQDSSDYEDGEGAGEDGDSMRNRRPKSLGYAVPLDYTQHHNMYNLEYDRKQRRKKTKKGKEFITARWLTYAILIMVTGLDAINLYSQVSYAPASYGQVVDSGGYLHAIIDLESNGALTVDFTSPESMLRKAFDLKLQPDKTTFRYHALETMCPHKMNGECLDDLCINEKSPDSSPNATNILEWNWWMTYFDSPDLTPLLIYTESFSGLLTSHDKYKNNLVEIVVDTSSVINQAFKSPTKDVRSFNLNDHETYPMETLDQPVNVSENSGETEKIWETIPNMVLNASSLMASHDNFVGVSWENHWVLHTLEDSKNNSADNSTTELYGSFPGDIHLFRSKRCICYKLQTLKSSGIYANLGNQITSQMSKERMSLNKLGSTAEGSISSCFYGEPEEEPESAKDLSLLDGPKLVVSCNRALFYEMKLGHAEYLEYAKMGSSIKFHPSGEDEVLKRMNGMAWFYSGFNMDMPPNVDMDMRCMGCLPQSHIFNGRKPDVAKYSNVAFGTTSTLRYAGVVAFKNTTMSPEQTRVNANIKGFYFSNKCANLDSSTLTNKGEDEEVKANNTKGTLHAQTSSRFKLPTLNVQEYTCVTTTGKLNLRYTNAAYTLKLGICLVPFVFVMITILRIFVDYLYRSLYQWKLKKMQIKEDPENVPEHKKDKVNGCKCCKGCLLSCCLFIHCKKKGRFETF